MKGIMYRALVMALTLCLLLSGIGRAQETAEGGALYTLTVDNIRFSCDGEEEEPVGFKGVITFGGDVKGERGLIGVTLIGGAQGDTPIIEGKIVQDGGRMFLSINGVRDVYAISMDDLTAVTKDVTGMYFGGGDAETIGELTELLFEELSVCLELAKYDFDGETWEKLTEISMEAMNMRKVAQQETVEIFGRDYTLDRYEGSYTMADLIDMYDDLGEVDEVFGKVGRALNEANKVFERTGNASNGNTAVCVDAQCWTEPGAVVQLLNTTSSQEVSLSGGGKAINNTMAATQIMVDGKYKRMQEDIKIQQHLTEGYTPLPLQADMSVYVETDGLESGKIKYGHDITITRNMAGYGTYDFNTTGDFDLEFETLETGAINGVLSLGGAFGMRGAQDEFGVSMDILFETGQLPEGALMDVEGRDIQDIIEMTQDDLAELQTQLQTQMIISMGAAMQTEGVARLISQTAWAGGNETVPSDLFG